MSSFNSVWPNRETGCDPVRPNQTGGDKALKMLLTSLIDCPLEKAETDLILFGLCRTKPRSFIPSGRAPGRVCRNLNPAVPPSPPCHNLSWRKKQSVSIFCSCSVTRLTELSLAVRLTLMQTMCTVVEQEKSSHTERGTRMKEEKLAERNEWMGDPKKTRMN